MGKRHDYSNIEGKQYGRWAVLRLLDGKPTKALCRCECGREFAVFAKGLVTGKTTQCLWCGNAVRGITHGMSDTRVYHIWKDMVARCISPACNAYENYGARGIQVAEEWLTFEPFYEWSMTHGYSEELSIDRIDNDGNYEPSNCRWATTRQQSLNKRSTRYATIYGKKITLTELSEMTGILKSRLDYRYDAGIRDEHILAPPGKDIPVAKRAVPEKYKEMFQCNTNSLPQTTAKSTPYSNATTQPTSQRWLNG